MEIARLARLPNAFARSALYRSSNLSQEKLPSPSNGTSADENKSVHPDALRDGDTRGHQHRRPDHGVKARDVLADHVQVGGPQLLVIRVRKSGRREIIRQS